MRPVLFQRITLQYVGRKTDIMKDIMKDIQNELDIENDNHTSVFVPCYDYWQKKSKLRKRPLESLILKENQLETIINDIKTFKNNESKYLENGIPYHRGYLLHGPPGCGKTSIVSTLASFFEMNIYFCNMSSFNSSADLMSCFSSLSENSIVVIEDIDAIFKDKDHKRKMDDNFKMDFSTLINILDGICSSHGTIVFMTTNHLELLDDALIRPGRVDKKYLIDYCDKFQIESFIDKFCPEQAESLKDKIIEDKIPPVELQNYFLEYENDPKALIENLGILNKEK